MIKTSLGAQRYNNKMNKIFEDAKILKEKYKKYHIQQEVLAVLNDTIDSEIEIMGNDYTIAEIAREVLLSYSQK